MEMEPLETAYPLRVMLIAIVFEALLVTSTRILWWICTVIDRRVSRVVPQRVSYVLTTLIVGYLLIVIVNGVLARFALNVADSIFSQIDEVVDEEIPQPTHALASGSAESLIPWDSIGRRGKEFIIADPDEEQLSEFSVDRALLRHCGFTLVCDRERRLNNAPSLPWRS